MKAVTNLLACIAAIFLTSYIMENRITFDSPASVLVVAVILWLINTLVRPIIKLVTLPLTILTLGLFSLVVNTLMVMLADSVVPGISFGGFFSSFILAIVISIMQVILSRIFK